MLIVTRLMNDHIDDDNDPLVMLRIPLRFSVRSPHVITDDHHSSKFDGLSLGRTFRIGR
jgi:hypothetical protein